MKLETILSKGVVPDKILLSHTSSGWTNFVIWKLSDYSKNSKEQPYIENIPYNLFTINARNGQIVDGRGFHLRLNSQNVAMLLTQSKIKNSRIAEPCQYIKINRTFWLLPTRIFKNGQALQT